MSLRELLLMDAAGNFHFNGLMAKPFRHAGNGQEWVVIVGVDGGQEGRVWTAQSPSLDVRQIAQAALDWFISEEIKAKGETVEVEPISG